MTGGRPRLSAAYERRSWARDRIRFWEPGIEFCQNSTKSQVRHEHRVVTPSCDYFVEAVPLSLSWA